MADVRQQGQDHRGRAYYTGTRHELIRAGVALAEWFPVKFEKMWRRDGRPYIANDGRTQRTRRTYIVDGTHPKKWLTTTHRRGGARIWRLTVDLSDEEKRRQKAEEERRLAEWRAHDEWRAQDLRGRTAARLQETQTEERRRQVQRWSAMSTRDRECALMQVFRDLPDAWQLHLVSLAKIAGDSVRPSLASNVIPFPRRPRP